MYLNIYDKHLNHLYYEYVINTWIKGKATHSSILAWRIPWTVHGGHKESITTERLSLQTLRWKGLGKNEDILFIPRLCDVCLPLSVNQQR